MEYNKVELEKSIRLEVLRLVFNKCVYLKRLDYVVDDETRKDIKTNFINCIDKAVEHFRRVYSNGFLEQEGELPFTLEGMDGEARIYFDSIFCTIKPIGEEEDPLMSFKEGVLVDCEYLEMIPGIPEKYKTESINSSLKGYDIVQVLALFNKWGIEFDENLMDMVVEEYNIRNMEQKSFVKAVIESLLLSGNKEDFARAYLVDYYMKANFDFETYKSLGRTMK